ncbi:MULTISPECIES: caspase family protein [unclassified Okeania]|uniref:caspase family protein n=1 Tax=unclassified Okeania TaxID=2634635 RepID=UPI0013BD8381|nr:MULTISPECIES: caspase family protein [unclassified Okeania]NES74685.1 caspase family protein [Okeania sp. SIO1H4]NET18787.1 caspase family protein [Okeania sp. SIO1H5]NET93202.1 caspase family protein [Okeania sp. SIO1H2]
MGLKRREFLQRASLALGALGISEAWWWRLQSRYSTALAQTTGRKLALLIGINEYPDAALSGCVTDVEMQQELLVHKFGFLPTDILTLTNKQATRENIETAFIDHLTNQARPDDLVLFHFSGYGSRVSKMINENEQNESSSSKLTFQNTLVPIDAVSLNNEGRAINDVLEETLWLLVQSLDTTKVVTVLDTSYVYPGQSLQGFLRVRSRPSSTTEQINKKEKAMQTLLRDRLSLERRQPINQSQLPGLILNASRDSQFATETDWNGFSSGLFTYALTQNLWHTTPATKLQISFAQSTSFVEQLAGTYQQPELKEATQQSIAQFTKKATITPVATPYQNLLTSLSPPASGVVNSVEDNGKTATLWLGGLPINVLDAVTYNSLFTTVPSSDLNSNNYQFKLQIRSRSGLKAKASIIIETNNSQELSEQEKQKFENGENLNNQTQKNTQTSSPNPQLLAGEMVREKIRILPKPTELTIALDRELSRIERVDATSGFSAESQVTVVNNIQAADYIFSRVPETTIAQSLSAPLPSMYQGRYALFSLGEVLIPTSVGEGGEGGEAVKVAVQRLSSQLKTLLAAKILRLTRNESSTQIKVRANFATITPEAKIVMRRETLGVSNEAKFKTNIEGVGSFGVSDGLLTLPIGSRIQCRSYNDGDRPVYFMLFSLDSSGRIFVLDPAASNQPLNNNESSQTGLVISPEDSVNMPPVISNFPRDTESFGWKLIGPKGLAESLIICSHQPFKETIAALNGEVRQARNDGVIQEVLNPLNVAQAVLRDLQSASQSAVQSSGLSTDDYALDINSWATMSFLCRIV